MSFFVVFTHRPSSFPHSPPLDSVSSVTMSSAPGPSEGFSFKTGDLVLVKWNDGMVYFAKIKKIDKKRRTCIVVFDDKSQDEADFSQVHSGEWKRVGSRSATVQPYNYKVCGGPC